VHPNHEGKALDIEGIDLIEDIVTPDEESDLIRIIDNTEWKASQSGRLKQVINS